MADERLPCWRSVSIVATRSDRVRLRSPAISFSPFQNASSRLTLVLWPAITMERLTTGDFIDGLLVRFGVGQESGGPSAGPPPHGLALTWGRHRHAAVRRRGVRLCHARHACGPSAD